MAGHRIVVAGMEIIDADAVAAVVAARTVEITAAAQMQAHMGAATRGAEEDQITGFQQARFPHPHGHRPAEALLEIGIPGQPDACGGMGGLDQPGTIKIRTQSAPPEVLVGPQTRLFGKGQHPIQPSGDGGAIQAGKAGRVGGQGGRGQLLPLQPAGVAILKQTNPQTRAGRFQHLQVATRRHLSGQTRPRGAAKAIESMPQAPEGAHAEGIEHGAA